MKTALTIYVALFVVLLCSCKNDAGGTTAGNPLVSFSMAGSSAPKTIALNNVKLPLLGGLFRQAVALPPPVLKDSTDAAISLNEAWISVKKVEFKSTEVPGAGEVSGDSVSFETPTAINLIASTLQSFGQARVGASLRRVKMQLHNVAGRPSGAPLGLEGKSIYWTGTVGAVGMLPARSFTFSSTEGYEYELAGPNGVALTENSNVLLSIQIANLFRKIDMAAVPDGYVINQDTKAPGGVPCPQINASATDVYTCLKDGLKSESNLGKDEANDGELAGDGTVK